MQAQQRKPLPFIFFSFACTNHLFWKSDISNPAHLSGITTAGVWAFVLQLQAVCSTLLCFCLGGGLVNVNIGLALVDGSSCSVHKGCIPVCVCMSVYVCLRAVQPFLQDMSQRPRTVCQRTAFLRQGFIGFMQCIIRREGRGLCFDRVTAAGGGGVCCCFTAHAQCAGSSWRWQGPYPSPHLLTRSGVSQNKSPWPCAPWSRLKNVRVHMQLWPVHWCQPYTAYFSGTDGVRKKGALTPSVSHEGLKKTNNFRSNFALRK